MSNTPGEVQKISEVIADPTPLGVFGLAMVTLVAASQKLGWTSGTAFLIPWAFFLGATAQLFASYWDFKHNNLFGATVLGAFGLFWYSVAMAWMIKGGVFGAALAAQADVSQMGFAFFGYFIFSVFATVASLDTNKVFIGIMVLIDALLICLALDSWGFHWAHSIAAWSELGISILGFYASGAIFLNKFAGRVVLPIGKPLGILRRV
ncbi:acetate uptake transporter [Sporomusa termitida]|uniref:Succinate-acetate/proton symporter SatP n=1 Tax=Sporomusa termitida TaxID=2377 RepID=A0A517DU15_9FIRM|nr:GPR1/FUN34/YaaH family transporter [Sporomusa termitida]QDR80839.1 Succinate-acetate/proton symporter SatP [Sporomusa termitida]